MTAVRGTLSAALALLAPFVVDASAGAPPEADRLASARLAAVAGRCDESVATLRDLGNGGNVEAQALLGTLHFTGECAPRIRSEAQRWLTAAAEQGHPLAATNLALLFLSAEAGDRDPAGALRLLRLASDRGVPEAQCALGLLYARGEAVERDDAVATAWVRKAAEQGLAAAQFLLGVRYEAGRGVERDSTEAWAWLDAAARGGHRDAAERRDALTPSLPPGELEQARARSSGVPSKPARRSSRSAE